jgi:hypothetical protein
MRALLATSRMPCVRSTLRHVSSGSCHASGHGASYPPAASAVRQLKVLDLCLAVCTLPGGLQAMQKHGIRITTVTPQSPRVVLRRCSIVSQPSIEGSTPSTSARGSPVVRGSGAIRNPRPMSARREGQVGGTNSPGASLHATREHFEALSRAGAAARHAVRSEDSMSSMGSMMSAFSRDPSVSRESVLGFPGCHISGSHGPQSGAGYPSSTASDGGRPLK